MSEQVPTKALSIFAVLLLAGCEYDECRMEVNTWYVQSIEDCMRTPGCVTTPDQLSAVRNARRRYPQCFAATNEVER